jgi:hypothetical protein
LDFGFRGLLFFHSPEPYCAGVSPAYVKSILAPICELNLEARAWELKKQPDWEFVRSHPKVVESYAKIWRDNSEKYDSNLF